MRLEVLSTLGAVCVVLAALLACFDPQPVAMDAARVRAANELRCDKSDVVVTARTDLSPVTYDVEACGRVARYTCRYEQYGRVTGPMACIPEVPVPNAPPMRE